MLYELETFEVAESESHLMAPFEDVVIEGADTLLSEDQADYQVIGADTRRRIRRTTKVPFRYICNLEYRTPGVRRRSMCTGTLIGPSTILTAGHCIAGRRPELMRVIPGRNGRNEPLPSSQAARFVLPNGYRPVSVRDYGIIHLCEPIGRTVGFWSLKYQRSRSNPVGTSMSFASLGKSIKRFRANLSGYPADKPGNPRFRCKTGPREPICGTFQYGATNRTVRLSGGLLHYLNDTFPGQSGSPVWIRRRRSKGGRIMVGIHVAGDDPRIPGEANRAVRLNTEIRGFILRNLI